MTLSGRLLFWDCSARNARRRRLTATVDGLCVFAVRSWAVLRIVAVDTRSDVAVSHRVVMDGEHRRCAGRDSSSATTLGHPFGGRPGERDSEASRVQLRCGGRPSAPTFGGRAILRRHSILATRLRDAAAPDCQAPQSSRSLTLVRTHRRSSEYTAVPERGRRFFIRGNRGHRTEGTEWTQPVPTYGELFGWGLADVLPTDARILDRSQSWIWRLALDSTAASSYVGCSSRNRCATRSRGGKRVSADLSAAAAGRFESRAATRRWASWRWRVAPSGVLTARLWTRRLSGLALPAIGTGAPLAESVVPVEAVVRTAVARRVDEW